MHMQTVKPAHICACQIVLIVGNMVKLDILPLRTAARQSFKEQEALVYPQLAQLMRDGVWVKSYQAAVMRLEHEAFQVRAHPCAQVHMWCRSICACGACLEGCCTPIAAIAHLIDAVCEPCGALCACYIFYMQQRVYYKTQGLLIRRMHKAGAALRSGTRC